MEGPAEPAPHCRTIQRCDERPESRCLKVQKDCCLDRPPSVQTTSAAPLRNYLSSLARFLRSAVQYRHHLATPPIATCPRTKIHSTRLSPFLRRSNKVRCSRLCRHCLLACFAIPLPRRDHNGMPDSHQPSKSDYTFANEPQALPLCLRGNILAQQ